MAVRVGVATRAVWTTAARLLYGHLPDPTESARHLVYLLRSTEIDSDGFFVAADDSGAVLAAILAVEQPGAQGQLLPPNSTRPEVEDGLVAEACRWLDSRGVKVVQSNLPAEERKRGEPLLRAGFQQVTRLFHCGVATGGRNPENESGFVLRPYAEIDPVRFARALISSYTDTLDSPELDGARTTEEILAGYRGAAGRTPLWFLAEVEGKPAGVLLLGPGDGAEEREIAYFGVVPEFRRRGIGTALARAAIRIAGASGATRLTLGVDERNLPAIRTYENLGFLPNYRSVVYLKIGPG